eukprot:403336680
MSSNGSNSTAARNNHRSRSSQNGAVNRSNTNNSSQYKKKQHQSNRSNKNSLQLTTQEKESEEILSNREIQSKRDNIMKDEDIKNILQDVQAYSIPHFENMDLNLVNEIRQIYKDNLNSLQEGNRQGMNNSTNSQPNNSKNLGTGGGWSVLSDILSKYPKHQSVAVVIKKLREEAKQEQLMKESSDKRKDRKLGKFKSASKVNNLTLKDFKTSEAADKSEHFRNIQLNLKQLEIIKDDFKRLKEIDKDQKLWLNRFMLKQNLIHKKVQYKRQDGIQKPLTIDKIIASSLNGGGQAQNALNSNLAKYDTLKSIISDDRKQSLQLDSSITVTNHKHQKQTNNNDQFHNNHNKNHTQMQKQPYLEYDAINRRELRSNQLSSRQAKTALQGGQAQKAFISRVLFQGEILYRGGISIYRRQQLQSNTLARGIQDEIKEVYEDAAMSPDYTQSKKSRIQSAQMQRRQKPSHVISHRKKYPIIENNNSKTITQDYSLNLISTPSELNNNNLRLPLNNQILTNQTQKNKYLNINELVKSIQHDSSLDKLDSTLQSPISNQNQKPIHISRRIIKPSFVEESSQQRKSAK